MMSNPPSSLQQRQRLHRRQNSTPVVALEAMKVANNMLPQQRQVLHRRGQSFDQQRSPIRRHQPGSMVSMTNLVPFHGQQILREAQQQRIARPGQQIHSIPMDASISAECAIYSASSESMPGTPFDHMTMNAIMRQNSNGMEFANSQHLFSDMIMPPQGGFPMDLMDENNPQFLQGPNGIPSQHGQGMPFEARRMSQPDLRVQTHMRPHTPAHQVQTAQFPLTPPFTQPLPVAQYSRSLQASPNSHSAYPVPMSRGRSLQGISENEEAKTAGIPFELADIPVPPTRQPGLAPSPHGEAGKTSAASSPGSSHHQSSEEGEAQAPNLSNQPVPILTAGRPPAGSASPGRPALSPRRMSISDLKLEPGIEASIEETNITLDDIAQFIEGPDPIDNKWICKYEDCNKRFGRKENIKSHVQTHLGDRQFRCDHCKKCFVRGHDLKRHAKIHTGTKPYPCLCGNSFARHDALTRHRQRGMCIGAFDGIVKKVIKRGRPRKHRPEMEDRLDKASRTRQIHSEPRDPYTSSASSCSISSWGSPPTEHMDNLSIRGTSPFDSINLFGMPQPHGLNMDHMIGFPPDTFSFTPPASPGYSTGNKPSPTYRELTPADLGDIPELHTTESQLLSDLPAMDHSLPMMNSVTDYTAHSLPSLSHSSSSPAADVVAFDFSDMPTESSMTMHSASQMPLKLESDRNDFDNFLDYSNLELGLDASSQAFFSL